MEQPHERTPGTGPEPASGPRPAAAATDPAGGLATVGPQPAAEPARQAGQEPRRAAVENVLRRYYAGGAVLVAGEPGPSDRAPEDGGRGGQDPGVAELAPAVDWEERLALVALTRVADPGDQVVGRAVRDRGAQAALSAARAGHGLPGASRQRTDGYALRAARADPLADLAAAQRAGARFVCPGDGDWPAQLDDLGLQRPLGLWVRGRPSLRLWALRSVAVVGARACTDYGACMATRLGAGLADAGWVVVSGAAYGVDGAVHTGALARGGATIGVVASGVDVAYPRGNTELIETIAARGLLVGELPPGDHPTRTRFILRNRVIAALTRGTVVVEARHRSGSLITARRASELGRITMGVPGPCTSGLSEGVHELLRKDAVVVTDAAEIVEMVGEIGADLAPHRRGPVLPRDRLGPAAARVLEAVPGRGGGTQEDIARAAGSSCADTLGRLYELQALGFVSRVDGRWTLVRTSRDRLRGEAG